MSDRAYAARALQAELRLLSLLESEGIAPPDEVLRERDPDELILLWHEPKVAVVVELWRDDAEPTFLASNPPV